MSNYFKFEPVRTLAALQALGAAVVVAIAFATGISADAVAIIQGILAGVWALLATFVRGAVTPNETVEELLEEQADDLLDVVPVVLTPANGA